MKKIKKFEQPTVIEFVVNGRTKKWYRPTVSHDELILLAFSFISVKDYHVYTITYLHGENGAGGSLTKGDKISIVPGMIFNIAVTNRA